ncbi:MAG: hypothetical protein OXO54_11225 [Chloroflexota bacterium]|nr:hypothetical protein [Chloroflexota bacterium]MDE2898882.1 hypothetical protein [Chloroflexota bacterium]
MSRNWLLAGLASALIAAAIVVLAIDVDEATLESPPTGPTPTPEERTARMMRTFVSRVIEQELRPRVGDLEGTRVVDGSGGTATVSRIVEGGSVELRIAFDAYVLLLDPNVTVENEIQADGTVSYTLGGDDAALRVRGTDVRIAVLDAEGRNPGGDAAGRFTFDLSGADIAGLAGEAVRNEEERLEIRPATPAP